MPNTIEQANKVLISFEYENLKKVFILAKNFIFSNRKPYNYLINFIKSKKLLFGKTNSVIYRRIKYLKKYLRKSFKTKVIQYFILFAAVLIIFVSQNNKILKLVGNYWFLNDIITKNHYFLLLIAKTLNRLTSVVVFTKLNILKIFII